MQFPHDDWFIDPTAIQRWIMLKNAHSSANLIIANNYTEFSCPSEIPVASKNIFLIPPGVLPAFYCANGPFVWSAIFFNYSKLFELNFPSSDYCIFSTKVNKSYLMPDDFHSSLFLLSKLGPTIFDSNFVSVRGLPHTSFCKTSPTVGFIGNSSFYIFSRLLTAPLKLSFAGKIRYLTGLLSLLFSWQIQRREVWKFSSISPAKGYLLYVYIIFFILSKLRLALIFSRLLSLSSLRLSQIYTISDDNA